MQLDKTHVAIRARSFAEIGDLALALFRNYPQSIFVGLTLGAIPWILMNTLLVGWIPLQETAENVFDEETVAERYRYVWLMCSLVYLQAPLAAVLTTTYIGQAVFESRPTWASVFRDTLKVLPQLIWTQGVLRGPLPVMLMLIFTWMQPFSVGIEFFLLGLLLFLISLTRGFRPFMPEIILLERCPLQSSKLQEVTARKRSALLHNPVSGELLGRFFLNGAIVSLIALSLFSSMVFLSDTLLNTQKWSLLIAMIALPLALWLAAGFATLLRYLMYLDTRIRLEGWEVELALRAEGARQSIEEDGVYQPRNAQVGNSLSGGDQ